MQGGLNAMGAFGAGFVREGVFPYGALLGNKPCAACRAYARANKATLDFINMAKHATGVERECQWDERLVHVIRPSCAPAVQITTPQ